MEKLARDDETLDNLLGGRLKILQKAKGYRFSLDALLLAHFVRLRRGDKILELGTGSAVISLLLAHRWENVSLTGIDIQESLLDMAARSVALNGLDEKIRLRRVDVKEIGAAFPARSFDVVIANPPYRKMQSGRINPDQEKAMARHEIAGTLRDFLKATGHVLKPGGRACFIYPATRLVELISSLREFGVEPKRMLPVYSRPRSPAQFFLVEGLREGGEELEVLPPLYIYDSEGAYTEEMNRIFRELSSPGAVAS